MKTFAREIQIDLRFCNLQVSTKCVFMIIWFSAVISVYLSQKQLSKFKFP